MAMKKWLRKKPAPPQSQDNNQETPERSDPLPPREFKIPVILLGVGLVILVISTLALGGAAEAFSTLISAIALLLIQIPLTILALYILASLLGITYGNLWSAILKLAAITIFVEALAFTGSLLGYPIISRVALLPVAWFLFSFLFDLDFTETFYSIVGLGFISGIINWIVILVTGQLSRVPT